VTRYDSLPRALDDRITARRIFVARFRESDEIFFSSSLDKLKRREFFVERNSLFDDVDFVRCVPNVKRNNGRWPALTLIRSGTSQKRLLSRTV
jgi:hypothetical protein